MPLPPPSVPHPEDAPQNQGQPLTGGELSPAGAERGRRDDTTLRTMLARNVDLTSVLQKISENDAARWMVVKDRLDHGPFSGRELVRLIVKGEVRREHGLINMDTGRRQRLGDVADFVGFLDQQEEQERRKVEQLALQRSESREKRSNLAKFVVVAAVLLGVGVVAAGFLLSRKASRDKRNSYANLADLFDRGEVRIVGSVESLPAPSAESGRRGSGRRVGSAAKGSSYEAAMNRAVNLGDASRDGSESQLPGSAIAGTMNRHIRELFGCVGAELRQGEALSVVQLDLAIAGSGQVLGVSTRQGSAGFRRCVEGRALKIRFPKFGAARMGARYSFRVD